MLASGWRYTHWIGKLQQSVCCRLLLVLQRYRRWDMYGNEPDNLFRHLFLYTRTKLYSSEYDICFEILSFLLGSYRMRQCMYWCCFTFCGECNWKNIGICEPNNSDYTFGNDCLSGRLNYCFYFRIRRCSRVYL